MCDARREIEAKDIIGTLCTQFAPNGVNILNGPICSEIVVGQPMPNDGSSAVVSEGTDIRPRRVKNFAILLHGLVKQQLEA
jgi:hypothetical protein